MPDIPRIQRKIPAPFQRPAISLDGAGHQDTRRDWRTVIAADLHTGDTVPGIGQLVRIERNFDADSDTPWTITVEGLHGTRCTYAGNTTVFAFTASQA